MDDSVTRLLLIEDDPGDVRLVGEQLNELELEQFELEHVARLDAGLARLATGAYDLLLLDLNLPDSHGPATLERAQAAGHALPIVVLTGAGDEQTGAALVHRGAEDYLLKGELTPRILIRSIRYALVRHATRQAAAGPVDRGPDLAAVADLLARTGAPAVAELAKPLQTEYDALLADVLAVGSSPDALAARIATLASAWARARIGPREVLDLHRATTRRRDLPESTLCWVLVTLLGQLVGLYRDGVPSPKGRLGTGDPVSESNEESAA